MAAKRPESMDLSEIPPSTTTISTVAVQAGRAKVVLAVLRVRVARMYRFIATNACPEEVYPLTLFFNNKLQINDLPPSPPKDVCQLRADIFSGPTQ